MLQKANGDSDSDDDDDSLDDDEAEETALESYQTPLDEVNCPIDEYIIFKQILISKFILFPNPFPSFRPFLMSLELTAF